MFPIGNKPDVTRVNRGLGICRGRDVEEISFNQGWLQVLPEWRSLRGAREGELTHLVGMRIGLEFGRYGGKTGSIHTEIVFWKGGFTRGLVKGLI